ncbi:hypothetical protein E2C01_011446 [Portunus trituberculatus]|uniref:Uncharacterized protein n=1 Tax=Portunus trituberculatus TaxID=210409 RepID=A0A5B7DB19_PORTR|nr:hypothetical protein [Portunus trituberculatus]
MFTVSALWCVNSTSGQNEAERPKKTTTVKLVTTGWSSQSPMMAIHQVNLFPELLLSLSQPRLVHPKYRICLGFTTASRKKDALQSKLRAQQGVVPHFVGLLLRFCRMQKNTRFTNK